MEDPAAEEAVPRDVGTLTEEDLPVDLKADFVPPAQGDGQRARVRREIDPFQYDSLQAQEAFDAAVAAADAGKKDRAIHEYIRAAKIAEAAHEWHLAAVACRRVGDFLVTPNPPYDLERAFRMYRRAVHAYEQCGLFGEARQLAYRQLCFKLRRAGELGIPFRHRLELWLNWAIAGFGYHPLRVIATAVVIVFLYAFAYWAADGIWLRSGTHEHVSFWQAIYFSGITFATVGYGDFIPAPHLRLVALTEGFLGAMTMGLFVAVLAGRLSRT